MSNKTLYIAVGAVIILACAAGAWFVLLNRPAASAPTATSNSFGSINNNTSAVSGNTDSQSGANATNGTQTVSQSQTVTQQKIFPIAPGPVVSATVVQTLHPTTTLARYISAQDGHVYDLPLDVPGVIPRVVSNTTIPAGYRAVWVEGGAAAIMQYLEGSTIKTVYIGLPASSTQPTRIKFLPDNIEDIAVSPDGKSITYLLTTSNGTTGYVASADGSGAKPVFSLPLSQVLISWPSTNTLLATSKAAAGVPGIAFSVDVKSGIASPLLYAQGLSAIADATFSHVIYQTIQAGASLALTFSHNVKTGTDQPLSFMPSPERCIGSRTSGVVIYCASPLQYTGASYLDLWHAGVSSAPDAIFSFNLASSTGFALVMPGGSNGGSQTSIFQLAASPDDHYLLYVTKGDRSLWGVRLGQ